METSKKYSVNPKAEGILNGIASTVLVIGWVLAICCAIIGIAMAYEEEAYYAIIGVLGGAFILLIFYVIWARLKVLINMSRNLYNIHEELQNIKELESTTEKVDVA